MNFNFSDKTFLVAGGCGFVGSNIVHKLVDLGTEHVYVLDDLFTGRRSFLPDSEKVTFLKGSIADEAIIDELVPKADYIINCAAVNIMAAQENPHADLEVNAGGTLKILEAARQSKRLKKFVYTSSSSIYGNPDYLPILETSRPKPMSNYAVSKLAGESYTRVYFLLHDIPTAVVRYSNVYGPHQTPLNPYCGVIGKFIKSAVEDGEINIYGTGLQTRDFTYVDDTVEATLMVAVLPKAEGGVFNIASGYEISVADVASKIFDSLKLEPKVNHIDKRDIDNISRRCLNIELIRTTLKWEPRFDVDSGLAKTIKWYLEHEHV